MLKQLAVDLLAASTPLSQLAERYLSYHARAVEARTWNRGNAPHWYDQRLYLRTWADHLDPHGIERGAYALEVMQPNCRVLDVGCGAGFYAHYFYASRAGIVDCIDIDPTAIAHAKKHHAHPNIRHHLLDAVTQPFPEPSYDLVIMDGSLGHFTYEQLDLLLPKIRTALGDNGLFVGYEVAEAPETQSWDHPIALTSPADFHALLGKYFAQTRTLYNEGGGRHNVFFRCSQSADALEIWKTT